MPTARKLPSGSWRCQVFSHYEYSKDKEGKVKKKRIYESFTSDDPSSKGKKEAERMATEFSYNKERLTRTDYTLKEAMDKYIKSKDEILSPTTLRGYKTLVRNAYTDILDKKIKKLNQEDIQVWANKYALTHAAKSVHNAHGLLSAVLSVYEPDLRLKTTLPTVYRPELYVPSDNDIKRLLKYIEGSEMEKAVLLAAFGTMRRGEIAGLEDTDISEDIITVRRSYVRSDKGGFVEKDPKTVSSVRSIEYPHFVIEKLMGVSGRLVKIHPEDISKNFGKILKEIGLPHFRFHDLRHYAASIMHALGIPDQYIMDVGGWKTDRVLKSVYRGIIEDEKKKFSSIAKSHFEDMQHDMQHDEKKCP